MAYMGGTHHTTHGTHLGHVDGDAQAAVPRHLEVLAGREEVARLGVAPAEPLVQDVVADHLLGQGLCVCVCERERERERKREREKRERGSRGGVADHLLGQG